jgi:peptidoglycan/LPS O-acetylase OafA/YrhL
MDVRTVNAGEAAVAPPPGNPRFPAIDGLRAVAVCAVVVTHTAFLSGFNGKGFLGAVTARLDSGVALFFVISGFLLYRPFVAARYRGERGPRVRSYARRRILRIVPAYWLALTVLTIWPGLLFMPEKWYIYYGFMQNLHPNYAAGGITAAWSLCCEMQFYILLPLYAIGLFYALRRLPVRTQMVIELVLLLALGALSETVRGLAYADPSPDVVSSTIAGTFWWFALGMALALISARWHAVEAARRPAALRAVVRWPLLFWVAAAAQMVVITRIGMPVLDITAYSTGTWVGGHVLYGLMAATFALPIFLGIEGHGGLPERFLTLRPVAWLGLVSYGVFLWHHPLTGKFAGVQDWTTHGSFIIYTLVVFGVALAAATLSYYLLERPILRYKDGRPRRPQPPADAEPSAPEAERVELARAG